MSRVLGLYSGNISADTLTFGCRRNVKPEMAEVKGKRLLIAAEMQEGARLNDSTVKQLCSTDDIFAEKKYKDPFSFSPSHSLVLYTNHLPKVSASDDGTWRRLIVIPFNAKIEGKSDIKNYGDYLYQNAGESILAWVIEGAKKVIDLGYKFPVPDTVQKAIDDYRSQNDWFGNFLDEKCEIGSAYRESSSGLYQAYRNHCMDTNEYVRSSFVQDDGWYAASNRYDDFIRRHKNLHILFLELGIGANTPVIIKYPFWQMTAKNPNATYACINYGEAFCPQEIEKQSVCINSDIAAVLEDL